MKEKAPTKVVDEEPLVAAARNTNDFTTFAIFMVSGDYFDLFHLLIASKGGSQ